MDRFKTPIREDQIQKGIWLKVKRAPRSCGRREIYEKSTLETGAIKTIKVPVPIMKKRGKKKRKRRN